MKVRRESDHFSYLCLVCQHVCFCQGPLNGGASNGGVSPSGLVLPFLSFLGLSRFLRDFPDLFGDGPGIFPIGPFPLSRPMSSTNEEQSRKGPRHNLDLSRKKLGNPPVWKRPGLGSLNFDIFHVFIVRDVLCFRKSLR